MSELESTSTSTSTPPVPSSSSSPDAPESADTVAPLPDIQIQETHAQPLFSPISSASTTPLASPAASPMMVYAGLGSSRQTVSTTATTPSPGDMSEDALRQALNERGISHTHITSMFELQQAYIKAGAAKGSVQKVVRVRNSLWKLPSPALRARTMQQSQRRPMALPNFSVSSYPAGSTGTSSSSSTSATPSRRASTSSNEHIPLDGADPSAIPSSPLQTYSQYGTGFGLGTNNPAGQSPGLSIRRLAEQFLNSLPDESPSVRTRSIRKKGLGVDVNAYSSQFSTIEESPKHRQLTVPTNTSPSPSLPLEDEETSFEALHEEIFQFSLKCEQDQLNQLKTREDLASRTRWAVRTVWSAAEVDLVGSVPAQVALPKSDLDFVVHFPAGTAAIANTTNNNETSNGNTNGNTLNVPNTTQQPATSPGGSRLRLEIPEPPWSPNSDNASPTNSTSSQTAPMTEEEIQRAARFPQAGSLIKLIGGRKKSKLLFRSTKIQVFKDINLIRLRDGCTGISIDLWFPLEPHATTRSQSHTQLIRTYLHEFPPLFPLACVIKTFMQQNLLNSGYSGLGSYGVLLMIIRFLQHERQTAKSEGREEERNLGRLLASYFRLYSCFDYVNQAISVVGDGAFIEKPKMKPNKRMGERMEQRERREKEESGRGDGDDDDEDDDDDRDRPSHRLSYDDEDDDIDDTTSQSSHPTAETRRFPSNDKFTMIIQDPQDINNQIICHNKALRNMIHAFIRACTILDPHTPPPKPPPSPIMHPSANVDGVPTAANTGISAQGAAPTHGHATSPSMAAASPGDPHSHSKLRRLIDVELAEKGPPMKPCPSPACAPIGTLCPIQNKACFSCGFVFVKPGKTKKKTQSARKKKAKNKMDGNGGNATTQVIPTNGYGYGNGMGNGGNSSGMNNQSIYTQQQPQGQQTQQQQRSRRRDRVKKDTSQQQGQVSGQQTTNQTMNPPSPSRITQPHIHQSTLQQPMYGTPNTFTTQQVMQPQPTFSSVPTTYVTTSTPNVVYGTSTSTPNVVYGTSPQMVGYAPYAPVQYGNTVFVYGYAPGTAPPPTTQQITIPTQPQMVMTTPFTTLSSFPPHHPSHSVVYATPTPVTVNGTTPTPTSTSQPQVNYIPNYQYQVPQGYVSSPPSQPTSSRRYPQQQQQRSNQRSYHMPSPSHQQKSPRQQGTTYNYQQPSSSYQQQQQQHIQNMMSPRSQQMQQTIPKH